MEGIILPDFPDYMLYPDGRIYCKKKEYFLTGGVDPAGYIQVSLRAESGKRCTRRLHRLLAIHFIPKKEGDGDLVDHINNDRTDYRLSNLRWTTPAQNSKNTKARNRDSYCISFREDRNCFQVFVPGDIKPKYVGRTNTFQEAIVMRDNALKGIFPIIQRPPNYCITKRVKGGIQKFEVCIPVSPTRREYVGVRDSLDEAQALRDTILNHREKDPDAWKPKITGKVVYLEETL